MELNTKVKELEDELKVLKAEIRNVLLDIREVVLDKNNPLAEEHETAFMRLDLNTTARSIAADAASREASAQAELDKPDDKKPEDAKDGAEEATDAASKGKGSRKGKGKASKSASETDKPEVAAAEPSEIPPMYRAPAHAGTTAALGLASWVADAMRDVGPQRVDRVITIHRLCGTLSPNVSEALAHLQELIRSTSDEDEQLAWLNVLQDLDRLASS